MKKTIPATEARKNFYELVRQATQPGTQIIITLENGEPVILMSKSDWEGLVETVEVMSDPKLMRDIERAKTNKDFISWEDMKKELGW